MSSTELPAEVRARLDKIAFYTVRLAEHAKRGELDEITSLLEQRAREIGALQTQVERLRTTSGAECERLLKREAALLEREASVALEQLQRMLETMRRAAGELNRQASAAKSYVLQGLPGPGLNRSG